MGKRTAEEIATYCFTVHPPPCEKCGDGWNVHEVDLEGPAPCDACDCASYVGPTVREHYQSQVAKAIQDQMDRAGKAEKALADLEWRVVANAGRHSREGRLVRWGHVSEAIGLGSTSATEMCRRAGLDPCEEVGTSQQEEDDGG